MTRLEAAEKAKALIANPTALGWALGYKDLREDLHGKWIERMLTATDDITLQAHRGSYKTTCLCEAIALMMIRDRSKNIIFLRKTGGDVTEVIENIQRILQTAVMRDIYRALTGAELQILRGNNSEVTTNAYDAPKGSAQLLGIGIGGSLTGKHADIVITDDIVNLSDRQSRAEREKTKAIYQELQNVKNRGGRIINTGTPWHKEDAFSIMPMPEKYDCYNTRMISADELERLRKSMAPSLFAANYELRHIASENALFETTPPFTADSSVFRDGIAHIDAAYGGSDYTAFTCGKRVGNKIYLYGRLWQRHVDRVLDVCLAEAQRMMCAPFYCEKNGDKGFLAQEIVSKGVSAHPYTERENKYVKISTFLRKWWQDIVFLEGTDPEYIAQIMDYTEDAEHDDAPDSASCVCRIYDRKGDDTYTSPFGG